MRRWTLPTITYSISSTVRCEVPDRQSVLKKHHSCHAESSFRVCFMQFAIIATCLCIKHKQGSRNCRVVPLCCVRHVVIMIQRPSILFTSQGLCRCPQPQPYTSDLPDTPAVQPS